jgi:hypothetical protein
MPALPNVPGVIRQLLEWDVGTDANAITVLHHRYAGTPPTSGQMNTFCASFDALAAAEWPLYLDADSKYLGNTAVDLTSPTAAAGADVTSVTGTRAGGTLGAGTAVLVDYAISRRYRGGKPRSYLPWGTGADLVTRNTWAGASVTDFHTGWGAIQNAITAAYPIGAATFVSFCVVSYYGPPNRTVTGSTGRVRTLSTVRAVPIVDDWDSYRVSNKVSSQRRRNLQRT